MDDIMDENVYELLEIEPKSTQKDIDRAYRRACLKYHPDKNPGDKHAEKMFLKVGAAYALLCDEKARGAYDNVLNARFARKRKFDEMDSERRKMKEALDKRERASKRQKTEEDELKLKLAAEIDRLREAQRKAAADKAAAEHNKTMREREAAAAKEAGPTVLAPSASSDYDYTIKVSWSRKDGDESSTPPSSSSIEELFASFGRVAHVLLGKKSTKKVTAVVNMADIAGAMAAMEAVLGGGIPAAADLKVEWAMPGKSPPLGMKPAPAMPAPPAASPAATKGAFGSFSYGGPAVGAPVHGPASLGGKALSDRDYESLTLHNMRRAAERQKLAEQIRAAEAAEAAAAAAN